MHQIRIDQSKLPPGEWHDEIDKLFWVDPETDYFCLAMRHERLGYWRGYVCIPTNHKLYGQYIKKLKGFDREITYADACYEESTQQELWMIGFDCAQAFDLIPSWLLHDKEFYEQHPNITYKNLRYVQNTCTELAKALKYEQ